MYEVVHFRSGVGFISLRLAHDVASLDNRFFTLRDNVGNRLLTEYAPLFKRKNIPCHQVFANNFIYFVETGNNPKENIKVYYKCNFCGAPAEFGPRSPHCRDFKTPPHTHTPVRTPLCERSACRRGSYQHNSLQTQVTCIHAIIGIRTGDPSNRTVSD